MSSTQPLSLQPLSIDELGRLHVLRRVALESVWGLLQRCTLEEHPAGEHLLRQGETNQTMYLILDGQLTVHLDNVDSAPVSFLESGETVGEISVIDDSPATAHVVVARPSRLLAVDEETFWRLIQVSHAFATNMLLLFAQRLRASNFKMTAAMRLREKLERDAMVDGLTNVFNRRWLDQRLPRFVKRFHFDALPLSVLMIDVDHFKRFNDTYGHLAGDQVLVTVARALAEYIRPTDYVVRYGGEEFVVILPATDQPGAIVTADRLRVRIAEERAPFTEQALPSVTISAGAATLREGEEAASLLQRADRALYRAKNTGRNRVCGEA